uniref:Uncharacterized protein n=1 Tax=Arundo donax TaxID=35708 RepID=A0A0A9MTN4_ARUDO
MDPSASFCLALIVPAPEIELLSKPSANIVEMQRHCFLSISWLGFEMQTQLRQYSILQS